ncbi:glutamate receptor ionotropic, delta-2-like isoform X3 [Homarus americanus]|uniref:glutamate receptor ionotropic, delta-2-like isoform X3 n=1 Tax=Homarus americanus TaxID=6706 RepID=UPI001C442932|nr:glutamate receptor ionotropic, delta-2-like isoform X3 [Homarus americanus]
MFMMALGRVAIVVAVMVVTQAAVPLSITQSQPPAAGPLVQQQEDVVSLLGEVAGGRLAACHPIILTHNITASPRLHTILLGLQQSMTNAFLIYDVETYLRSFPPGVPLLRRLPPESDGTYCVAYYVLAPLPLLAAALSAIPKTDWFTGATRYFVCCTGSSSSLAINTLEEEPSILASYNTLYVSHNPYHDPQDNRSWSLNLLSNCPFCRSGEPEVILRNKWSPWRGLQHHTDLFPDLFRDCNGHVFRAVTLSFPPLSHYLSGNSTHPLVMEDCLDKRIIDAVARVHNFTYVVYEPADGMWGYQLDNGSFTGVLGDVQHYRKDFSFGVSLTAEREEVTDCTVGYFSEPLNFVTSKPKPLPQWLALVRPYQAYVWLSFLLLLAAAGPTYWLLQKLSGSSQPLLEATLHMYGAMLTQGRRWPSSSAVRVYSASWLLFCLVVTVSYVGNLTAFLTVPALSPTVDSLEELVNSDFVWGINDFGAADYQLFKTSKVPLYQEIFRGLTFCPSLVECIQQTLDERFAFISWQTYLRDAIAMFFTDKNGDTQVYLAKQSFFPADVSFATQKGSPMKRIFDKVFKRLLGGGFTTRWMTTLIEEHTLATRRKATVSKGTPRSTGSV